MALTNIGEQSNNTDLTKGICQAGQSVVLANKKQGTTLEPRALMVIDILNDDRMIV